VVVLLLATIGLTVTLNRSMSSKTELKIAHNDLVGKQALATAEAGLRRAAKLIGDDTADGLNDELENGGTGDTSTGSGMFNFGGIVTDGSHTCKASFRFKAFPDIAGNDGYCVQVQDNFDETTAPNDPFTDIDNRVELIAIGLKAAARREVRAILQYDPGPDCALLTGRNLSITGDPTINGRKGCTHSDGDTTVSSDPVLAKGATASGTLNISGNPTLEGTVNPAGYAADHQAQAQMTIPSVRPFNFGSGNVNLATEVSALGNNGYLLTVGGNVYEGGTWSCTPTCSFSGGPIATGSWNGWAFHPGTPANWDFNGMAPPNGAFFVEGWVTISSSPGSAGSPWLATIIALDSIQVIGNPTMAPFTTTGNLRNLLLVSGNDVELNGSAGLNSYQGAVFAHQQFKLNGNPGYTGFIIAEDGLSNWTGDPVPACTDGKDLICDGNTSLVSGDPAITYDGLSTSGYGDSIELADWHETGE